jgi:hypothetical protein
MRDALDQYVVGGMYAGPGLYGGGWFLESDLADDLFTEIPVALEAEELSQVPGSMSSGRIDISEYPRVSGRFTVTDFSGRSYRVEIDGKLAYDQRGDSITLSASSRGKRVSLRQRGSSKAASARVSIQTLKVRSNYQRATMIRRRIR